MVAAGVTSAAAVKAVRAQRLSRQHLASPRLSPTDVVAAFGAMQAQEYAMAKWAIGLRSPGATDATIEALIADGQILRTHPLRWTHHFVTPADIRWLLTLLAPRMIARARRRFDELGLDERTFKRSQEVLARVLEGGKQLTRAEIAAHWKRARISPDGQRAPHMLGRAELDQLICSGARRGNQITFALLDERVPKTRSLARDESLAELARRYFTTRGPATLQDFMWWSGLPAADARAAVAGAGDAVEKHGSHWRGTGAVETKLPSRAYLLPTYDEYTVAYRDRSAIGSPPKHASSFGEQTMLAPCIVVDGEVVGTWRRTIGKTVAIELSRWRKLAPKQRDAVEDAADRYAAFIGVPRI